MIERRAAWIAAAIVVLAAMLRLHALGTSPPGMHPDAASNAWNVQCLLATGKDWSGTHWPFMTSRGFGQGQSTLYYYLLMPFQAARGMSPATTVLPSAVTGALSVLLIYLAGARWFGKLAGLIAAAVAALMPWHLFLSRWGHESGIVPFLVALPIAAVALARLPFGERDPEKARVGIATIAGLTTGLACYGYLAVRVFLPVGLTLAAIVNVRNLAAFTTSRNGRRALAGFLFAIMVTLGPLATRHASDPTIAKRAREFTSWSEGDGFATRVEKVAARYPGPYSPDFLFVHGDRFGLHTLPASGPLRDYTAPLLVAGLIAAFASFRANPASRTLLALVAVYPLADALARHDGPHLLRSGPGLVPLALAAGLGAATALEWLFRRNRIMGIAAASILALWATVSTARFMRVYFDDYNRRVDTVQYFNADLLEAIAWVKPRFADADALWISMTVSSAMDQPFVLALVGLDYDPKKWFADTKDIAHREDTDRLRTVGKIHFIFEPKDAGALQTLSSNDHPDHVLVIARPGEWHRGEPVHTVYLPDGRPSFLIYDLIL